MDSAKNFLEMVYKERKSISLLKRQYEEARKSLHYIKGLDYSRPHVTGGEGTPPKKTKRYYPKGWGL